MYDMSQEMAQSAVIKVIGIGGGGGNAVQHMIDVAVDDVEFICTNTDMQALASLTCPTKHQLGKTVAKGLGAGANPDIGRQAAEEDREKIVEMLKGSDMVFLTAGMGGGTGTGATPIFAEIAKELGILTVAVVTKPFPFEGRKRMQIAEMGIQALEGQVDSLIIIPNEKLLPVLGKETSLVNAFRAANSILLGAVQGIAELITCPGMINVDFADVKTVMAEMGMSVMGIGRGKGERRAQEAAERALRSPLLEEIDLYEAKGILVNITAGLDLSLGEFSRIGDLISEFASDSAIVVVGTVINTELHEEIRVTLVVTGLGEEETTLDGKTAIVPSIQGWAKVYGYNNIVIDDEDDPYAHGFQVI